MYPAHFTAQILAMSRLELFEPSWIGQTAARDHGF
jgi:hypothetical protein